MGRNQASLIVTQYFLGSISEAKNHLEDSRTRDDEDLKSVYQPITELCALSEVCMILRGYHWLTFLLAGIHIGLFKEYDVLILTTLTPITLCS